MTNSRFISNCGTIDYGLSDHLPVCCIKKKKKKECLTAREKYRARCYRHYDFDTYARSLSQFNWGSFYETNDVESCWEMLFAQIYLHCEYYAPFRTFFVHKTKPVWFSESIRSASIRRDRLLRKARSAQDNATHNDARNQRNRVKGLVNRARSDYYKEQLGLCHGNPRKFRRTVDDIIGDTSAASVTTIRNPHSGVLLDELGSANMINNYFVNIGYELDAALPTAPNTILDYGIQLHYDPDVTVSKFLKLVGELDASKHSGRRLIPSKLY